jgi:hypothetical protein
MVFNILIDDTALEEPSEILSVQGSTHIEKNALEFLSSLSQCRWLD